MEEDTENKHVPDLIEDIDEKLLTLDKDVVSNLEEYSSNLRQQAIHTTNQTIPKLAQTPCKDLTS